VHSKPAPVWSAVNSKVALVLSVCSAGAAVIVVSGGAETVQA
jgi:hypothetical protein